MLAETDLDKFVAERPSRARVFEALGIDRSLGGNELLVDACIRKGLDPRTVLRVIEAYELVIGAENRIGRSKIIMTEVVAVPSGSTEAT